MFRFQDSSILNWIFLVPVVLVLLHLYGLRIRNKMKAAFGKKLTPVLIDSVSQRKRFWKNILQALVIVLMIIAWARPQAGESAQEVKSEGVELMILVDVSESMMAEDLKPNRLEQAKIELGRLVERLPGHKIGIIAFAGSAVLLSPLTTDPAALKMYLDSLSPDSVSSQGTYFKKAIEEAAAAFERGSANPDPSARVTRVILIASDGEDNEEGALEQARKLVGEGVRIFTMAYGTERGAPIPQRDSLGFLKGYKKGPDGKEVVSQVHGEALRKLAEAGRGSFYHASFGGPQVGELVEDINKLEKAEFDSQLITQYEEKFQFFLWCALLVGLLEILLGERKAAPRLWKGRFGVGES